MPKSTQAELASLRDMVFTRDDWTCVWPGCAYSFNITDPVEFLERLGDVSAPIQMAHLTHRGMGGSKERNAPNNCVTLCEIHHDCLDGRTGLGILRRELNAMLAAQIR